jgi:hypothetical protein
MFGTHKPTSVVAGAPIRLAGWEKHPDGTRSAAEMGPISDDAGAPIRLAGWEKHLEAKRSGAHQHCCRCSMRGNFGLAAMNGGEFGTKGPFFCSACNYFANST